MSLSLIKITHLWPETLFQNKLYILLYVINGQALGPYSQYELTMFQSSDP